MNTGGYRQLFDFLIEKVLSIIQLKILKTLVGPDHILLSALLGR